MKLLAVTTLFLYSSVATAFLPSAFRAHYTQEEKSIATGRIKKSDGMIEYRQPGRIRFEITKPNKVVFVGNPKKAWFYTAPPFDGEPGEVTISKGASHPILKFFDVLAKGGLKDNTTYKVTKDGGSVALAFDKKAQDEFGLTAAKLSMGSDYTFPTLKEIAVTLTDGKTIRLELSKLEPNVAMPDSNFEFEIPANTRKHIQ